MAKFEYEVIDINGTIINGEIDAPKKEDAIKELKKNKYYIKSIRQKINLNFKIKKKIDARTKGQFFYKLHNILDSGVDLVRGLDLLVMQMKNKDFKLVVEDISTSIKEGTSFSDALYRHPKIFTNLIVQQVRAGEIGANIEEVFLDIHKQYENDYKLKKSITGAMIYPAMISLLGLLMLVVMIWKIIPVLKEAFESVDAQLPAITIFVLELSDNYMYILLFLLLIGILIVITVISLKKNENFRYNFDKYILKVPLLGSGIYHLQLYIFSKILGSLISIGIPVTEVFEVLEKTLSNKYILKGVVQSKESIERDGLSLSDVIIKSGVFNEEYEQLILIGEESGNLSDMLDFLASQNQEDLDNILAKVTNILSPIILSVVLAVVGVILIAMMLPMFTLINQI